MVIDLVPYAGTSKQHRSHAAIPPSGSAMFGQNDLVLVYTVKTCHVQDLNTQLIKETRGLLEYLTVLRRPLAFWRQLTPRLPGIK